MKTPPTMAQVLAILSVIIIPLLVWGISVETRFTNSIYRIEQNEKRNFKIESKLDRIDENTIKILLDLERVKKTIDPSLRENRNRMAKSN
jgi:hypothetical protein